MNTAVKLFQQVVSDKQKQVNNAKVWIAVVIVLIALVPYVYLNLATNKNNLTYAHYVVVGFVEMVLFWFLVYLVRQIKTLQKLLEEYTYRLLLVETYSPIITQINTLTNPQKIQELQTLLLVNLTTAISNNTSLII